MQPELDIPVDLIPTLFPLLFEDADLAGGEEVPELASALVPLVAETGR